MVPRSSLHEDVDEGQHLSTLKVNIEGERRRWVGDPFYASTVHLCHYWKVQVSWVKVF